jgi:phage terminase large subunit GpA-like protein
MDFSDRPRAPRAPWPVREGVFATIARDGQRPIVSSPSPRKWGRGERQVPLFTLIIDTAKALLMDRWKVTEHGPGYTHSAR